MQREYRIILYVWAALIALALLSLATAFLPLGAGNSVACMLIAMLKAALVISFFMKLKGAGAAVQVFAATGLFVLALLFGISRSDFAVRRQSPAPWHAPQAEGPSEHPAKP
jgi:cytochrome c oxidase subunit 4